MNNSVYACVGCGFISKEDFWDCPECQGLDVIQVDVDEKGKISEKYTY